MISLIRWISILAVILALSIAFYFFFTKYNHFVNDLSRYEDLNIGDTQDETLYALGVPTVVLDPPEFDAYWGGKISRTYQVDGKDRINKIPSGKSYRDYSNWAFESADGSRIDVEFDAQSMRISSIGCYSTSESKCPPIFGISTGVPEDEVLRILGKPTTESLDGVSKKLEYDDVGLDVYLSKRVLYYIIKRSRHGLEFPWSRLFSLSLNFN